MYCQNCGKVIDDNADICLNCGVLTEKGKNVSNNVVKPESNPGDTPTYAQQMVAILFPIAGVIMGLVYFSNGKPRCGRRYLFSGIISFAVVMTLYMLWR